MPQHVVVIGGGIVGVSTGIWLRRQGVDVTVIDRLGWGQGTSHGNGGVLAACAMVPVTGPGLWSKAPGMLMNPEYPLFLRWRYLPKLLPWMMKYMSHANDPDTQRIALGIGGVVTDAVEQHLSLSKDTRAAPWVVESDYSYAYPSRKHFEADAYSWAIRAEHGFTPVLREGAEAREFAPCFGPDITFLATLKNHGYIKDPGGYVAALGEELVALGGKLVIADVKDFDLGSGHVRAVDTTEGRFECTEVVLATGAWSKPLMKKLGISVPLESERGYHIVFKNAKGGPSHPTMIAAGKFVATPMAEGLRCAGIVEFGGLEAGPSKAPFALLRRQTKAAFPNLTWDGEIEWQGHRPATSDSLPLIGQIKDTGVYTGFGHHHIGLTAGPKTGRLLAQADFWPTTEHGLDSIRPDALRLKNKKRKNQRLGRYHMTSLKNSVATGVIAGAMALTALPAVAAEKWDMPMAYAGSNFHSVTGAEFAQCVTTGTGGEIEITTHPGGSLFAGADIKRAIQTGQVPIGERLLSGHQNESAIFGWDSIPFLVSSFDEHDKLYEAAKPAVEEVLAEQNLTLLYSVPWPPQGLYFRDEVQSAADMEGVKFRSYNNATSRLAELTGMLPVTIEAAEISQAFATGVADSMVSSGATGYDRKVWESLNYFYEVDAWLPRNYIMVNSDTWAGVSDANKNIVNACARMAEYAGTWRAKEYTGFTMAGLAAGGMTVERASDQLMSDLRAIGETMSAEWLEAAGEAGQAIIDAYNAN